jgi:threonine dehydrogenase-like Zn-dependent dehydrogenase
MHGDSVILFGAGGPMGQMHVQLVLENPKRPKTVVVTDIAENRLEVLREKFEPLAKKNGISYHVINPNDFSDPKEVREKILGLNGGKLFDYVVCLAAIPAVIEDAASYLGNRAILNIFAGVSRGTIAQLDVKDVVTKSVRWIGSSGSKLEDMEYTLRKLEKNELDTNSAVAGVAGMNDVWKGIDAVRTGSFPGKIVVYPHIPKLDLISLKELKETHPKIGALLSENGSWTRAAEDELLREYLGE